MKRGISTLLATVALALSMGASTASASDLLSLPGGQTNASDQEQIQIVPIAPQVNAQNVNVLTFDDVEQGNANNANTGQANQQENTATGSSGTDGREGDDCKCPDTRKESEVTGPTSGQTQANFSEQEQIQIVPVAPQVNAQNVNVLTFDDVEQGNANNANTGQASQQENTLVTQSSGGGTKSSGGPSQTGRQGNFSDQEQIQIVPIAPQVNLQNVNVATFGDVEQGDANNANTGQANQQENTQVSRGSRGTSSGGQSQTGRQGNFSEQEQIQIVPIAPQLNAQNVNVLTFGDVEQGNANNANTGQANQQSNTLLTRGSHGGNGQPARGGSCKCKHPKQGAPNSHRSGGTSSRPSQVNASEQEQIQIVPIAPQLNAQNVNVLTFGDVEQGNANNANTGQANQQSNTLLTRGSHGGNGQPARGGSCKCKHPKQGAPNSHRSGGTSSRPSQVNASEQEQIQIVPIAPQLNAQNVNVLTFGDVEQGNANNANTGQANQQSNTLLTRGSHGGNGQPARGGSCKCKHPKQGAPNSHRSGGTSSRPSQVNASEQEQIQIVPIAPQLNAQNVNVLTFGDVEQGNANNANTGQANQQSNTLLTRGSHGGNGQPARGGSCKCKHPKQGAPNSHRSGGTSSRPSQVNASEQEQIQIVPIAPQLNAQNVNVLTFGDVEQGNANNANTGQANQQSNTLVTHGGGKSRETVTQHDQRGGPRLD